MLKKGVKGKSMKVILAGSLIGMGTFTGLPDVKAAEETGIIQEVNTKMGLSKLEIDGATLNQGFSESVLDYRATAEDDVEKITLQAESRSGNAAIFVNGTKLTNGVANLPLQTGMNTFEITVSDGVNETVTYIVKVEKLQSGDNHLTSIRLSQGSLAFDPNVTAYLASVENKVKSVTVSPSLRDSNAHVMVNGTDAAKSGVTVKLPIGETAVKINVTAENGDERTYTLTITRADVKKPEKEKADVFKDVKGQKQPAIEKPSSTEGDKPVTLSARSFNDQKLTSVSQTVKVAQPENPLTKKMSAGIDKESAAEHLEKEDEAPVLNSLTSSTGSWNKAFHSNEHTYHIEVNDDITSVELQAAAGANGATIEYDGGNKKKVKLKNKAKTAISVTISKDGKRRTYVLVFEKDIKVEMDEE
ncbi:cadherin-like beta sandwich domain-containing protein [Peribacillus muralis]|uniref:cadherin-like beta sandwich domain-containing protein n=1 Tax=Peribacillus muralis TaxID=264697 RepID=UPI003CFD8358